MRQLAAFGHDAGPDSTGSGYAWFTSPRMAEIDAPALAAHAAAKAEPSAHPRDLLPSRYPDPQSKRSTFVHTFCLTAQGLDGDPVYLLDQFLCYGFKLFQDGGGFIKLCAGR